jgi:uncharacterized protein (DUF2336 family)
MTSALDTPDAVASAVSIGYEKAKSLARHDDPGVRQALAKRRDLRPELLYFLAEDTDASVRRAVAENARAPRQADLILASDHDEAVRTAVAGKVTRPQAGQDARSNEPLKPLTVEVLEILARDQVVHVRQILAQALKDLEAAPHSVVNRLARDSAMTVAAPILESSPVLTDTDLIQIIEARPAAGALAAIAGRAQVSADVADAVAATSDVPAVARLLSNASAQIREETLDRIIDQAPSVTEWHAPLVQRPKLSSNAARRLAHFVAASLLEELQLRKDLSAEALKAVAEVVHKRLEAGELGPEWADKIPAPAADLREGPYDRERRRARELFERGALVEQIMIDELNVGNRPFIVAALALTTGMPESQVRQVLAGHNAKAVVALTWKAQFSMALAYDLQIQLAGILPRAALAPDGSGGYALSPEELTWQLELFES